MMIREFALLVGDDCIAVIHVNEDTKDVEGILAGLLSDPKIIEVTGQNIKGFFTADLDPCKGLSNGK